MNLLKIIITILELFFLPLLVISGLLLKLYRSTGSHNLRKSTYLLKKIGVFPIIDHYHEPMFNDMQLSDLRRPRLLPGIDFNEKAQLELLKYLTYQSDFNHFVKIDTHKSDFFSFKINNGSFDSGDAEFLFNFIRHVKPSKIIEIGCGMSTKIIQGAIKFNQKDKDGICSHVCVEPHGQPELENFSKIELIRDKVENIDLNLFKDLKSGDLLFIDSSHIIRPQGDVLYEYLQIIPSLQKGVYVHVHDIFSPRDYLDVWIKDQVLFWNEQYLLEALLTESGKFEIVAALNLLKHKYYDNLCKVCPYLTADREPGSFYFRIK